MNKRALFALAGLMSLCQCLSAQELQRPDQLQFDGSTLNRSVPPLPALTFADRQRFAFPIAFDWMQPTADFLPVFSPVEPRRVALAFVPARRNLPDKLVDLRPDTSYAHGEVSVLYGRSFGKYGGDYSRGSVFGEVGNDNVHITVGAFYEESNARTLRFGR
jgi:hypothetical protein